MFGMYRPDDYKFYQKYKNDVLVVWCGSDGMKINPGKARILKSRKARHVVSSSFLADDLKRWGIDYKFVPHTPYNGTPNPKPEGTLVYHYGTPDNDFYKNSWIQEIVAKTGIGIISTNKHSYNKDELSGVYERCFLALRLTEHDGLPTTCVEMGLMGRKSIHNGDIPHAIKYRDIQDVIEIITEERFKENDVNKIAEDWYNYINIDDSWLQL